MLAHDLVEQGLLGIAGSVREGRARVRMRHARVVKGKESAGHASRSEAHAVRCGWRSTCP
jgi:hypothetical protein